MCLVLLILILACLARRHPHQTNINPAKLQTDRRIPPVYIVSPHPFSEIDEFVASSSVEYQLDVMRYELKMKEGLEAYLADRPAVKAIFVGTRRTDPHGERLTHFDRTDGGWPDFMRIHPVIDWHYGGTKDTQPNPKLKKTDEKNGGFLPAYELEGDEKERLGRDR
ncbi:hypothetical protein RRF57_008888 [Xylaria bambusicola]|uniref:FAD synthase n=1 Tax=Xylaria bambusicola TaxID=326684 RepID=A0AAN7UST2_9PEZI